MQLTGLNKIVKYRPFWKITFNIEFLKKLLINFNFAIFITVNQPIEIMKVQENKMDIKSIIDFALLLLLLISAIIYIEYSADFHKMMADIKYNSIAGLNDGIAALNSAK